MTIVPDFDRADVSSVQILSSSTAPVRTYPGGSLAFWFVKAVADLVGAVLLLPVIGLMSVLLLALNPILNPGPLFFRQTRMGKNRTPFVALKFRTMREDSTVRGPDDPVEAARITRLGGVLRRMGLDELPQAINVLRGEMSLIGPRPDCLHHAERFLSSVPDYGRRFCVRPGISGLSQIKHGYAVGTEATRAKAATDLHYIREAGFAMDLWIVWRTVLTVLTGRGD